MLVVDASVLLEFLLETPLGRRSAERLLDRREEFHSPHLLDVEFVQVLRKLTRRGKLEASGAQQMLEVLQSLPLTRHSHIEYLRRIWELRESISAYDAAYVALAEGLDAPLLTCDARLSRSHGHRADIVLLT
jgi:predicted nucleic acid-binding protein